jgi:membrane associated rhomboid family serine protease
LSREEEIDVPILPASVQPTGVDYWLGTISGRLMVINALVFAAMSWKSGSLFLPTREVLLEFGAKDPAGLVNGEYWRFLTPVFVHIGIIHFFFNSLGLYYIGYQLERMLGRRWFLVVYLAAGIAGNIASAVTTVVMSAGASGALFGLLGSGYVLERIIGRHIEAITGRRPRRRIYASMVVVNIVFGLLIPGIDNAAHMGGLVTGSVLTWAMLHIRPNRLQSTNKPRAWATIGALLAVCVVGAIRSVDGPAVIRRLEVAAESVQSAEQGVYFLDQALRIVPGDRHLLIERVKFVLMSSDPKSAIPDLQKLSETEDGREEISRLIEDFRREGLTRQVRFLEFFLGIPGKDSGPREPI